MSDQDQVSAWGSELRRVHVRLRDALALARESVEDPTGAADLPGQDLVVYCWGFCAALRGHHESEDGALFAHLLSVRPDLEPVVANLKEDHHLISTLIRALERTLATSTKDPELAGHLDGLEAALESHFRYEEKHLVSVLDTLNQPLMDRQTLFGAIA